MAYPEKLLNDGEEIILDTHPHWWALAPSVARVVLAIVIGVAGTIASGNNKIVGYVAAALIVVSVAALSATYVRWRTTEFVLTTDQLITRAGVFSRQGHEIPLERINDLTCHQSLFERVIHAGDVLVESAGERGQETFPKLADPFAVQNAIHRAMEAATTRPGGGGGAAALSIPEQIEKLDELRQRGVISQAEFDDKKRRLLDRM